METTIEPEIAGLGIIFYSPFAVGHIRKDEDYIDPHFWNAHDVAQHVNACQISAFGTGSPGLYRLRLYDGKLNEQALESAKASVRLGIEVRDGTLCFRDLYDFIRWDPECLPGQTVSVSDGFFGSPSTRLLALRERSAMPKTCGYISSPGQRSLI